MEWKSLNNLERGPPKDHSCEVWRNLNVVYFKLGQDDRQPEKRTDQGHPMNTKAHLESMAQVS